MGLFLPANLIWYFFVLIYGFTTFDSFWYHYCFTVSFFYRFFYCFCRTNINSFPYFFSNWNTFCCNFSSITSNLFWYFNSFFTWYFYLFTYCSITCFCFKFWFTGSWTRLTNLFILTYRFTRHRLTNIITIIIITWTTI